MNQQCKVCGEPAAGFHFGAFTCEGCKSFFGRTYNNISSISECKNNGECIINKKNRTACKACRLRKCLLVGMSKSGSRYGRRSNWFKIHCLLQEQQQQHHQHQQHQTGQQNNDQLHSSQTIQDAIQQNQQREEQQNFQNNNVNPKITIPLSPGLITNSFAPVNFLNGNSYYQKKMSRRTSSPSDSGASSADPEDSGSNRDTTLDSPIENKLSKFSSKLDTMRSLSEPLKFFPPTSVGSNPFLTLAHVTVPALIPYNFESTINIQEEPIDLSVKSRKRCRTTSPTTTLEIPRAHTPLDLTLAVRSNPLGSG